MTKKICIIISLCILFILCTAVAAMGTDTDMLYVGTTKTRVYHNSTCRYFTCYDCRIPLASPKEAKEKGFKPCKFCKDKEPVQLQLNIQQK